MTPSNNSFRWQSCLGAIRSGFSLTLFLGGAVIGLNLAVEPSHAAGTVVAWGENGSQQSSVPTHPAPKIVAAVAGGAAHSLALQKNGVLIGWGDNSQGETTTPSNFANVVAVGAGNGFSVALESNGVVLAWGSLSTVPAGLTNAVAIAPSLDNRSEEHTSELQ